MSTEPTATATLNSDDVYKTPVQIGDHQLIMDESAHNGGTDEGPSPVKSALGSLASCTAMTIRIYLDHKQWKFHNLKVEIYYSEKRVKKEEPLSEEEQEYVVRGRVRKIEKKIKIEGDLDDDQLKRVEKISQKCPVHQMMTGSCMIYDEVTRL